MNSWLYNSTMRRWQTTIDTWIAGVERWASYNEYIAWIAPADQPEARIEAPVIIQTLADAQVWCEAMIQQRRLADPSVSGIAALPEG